MKSKLGFWNQIAQIFSTCFKHLCREAGGESFDVTSCKDAAQEWLGYLRRGTTQYDWAISFILEKTKEGSFSLSDLGTDKEELEDLRLFGCQTAATEWLKQLRDGNRNTNVLVNKIHEEVRKGGFSLETIGTTREELATYSTNSRT